MRLVSVILINFNGMCDLSGCLQSVAAQDHHDIELILIDNCSTDGSTDLLRGFSRDPAQLDRFALKSPLLILNDSNAGFSAALNRGIGESSGELVMSLNTDVVLDTTFISSLVGTIERDPRAGSASGKLLRFPPGGVNNVIDSAGHRVFRNRLAENIAEGQRGDRSALEPAEVFGTCGAAALYRREMLEDVRVLGEYFDEQFFAFWEDLDMDWRSRMRGWRCLYDPAAIAYHRRGGAGYRKSLPVEYHNYKNHYLLMIKNDTPLFLLKNLPGVLFTELLKTGALLFRCPRALPALGEVFRLLPLMRSKRRVIQSARVVPARDMEGWFQPFPYRKWIRRHLLDRGRMIADEELERR